MPTVNCSPLGPKPQIELAAGTPAVGYKLFFYVGGSVNTKQTTYTDSTGTVANANPLLLNSLGQPTTEIWFTAGQGYKVVLAPSTDTDPPTSPVWSIDNLRGINDTSVTIDQWVSGPPATYVAPTQFSVAGDQTSIFQVGRRVRAVSLTTLTGRITVSTFAALTTVTVVWDSSGLDPSVTSPPVSYGLLSATNNSIPAIIAAGTGITVTYPAGIPTIAAVAANNNVVGQCRLSRASSTSLLLSPQAGNLLTVNGVACTIPDGGVSAGIGAPAAANTTYYIYAIATAGVVTSLEASATGWSFSTTAGNKGTPIKTGDDTRTLVGMARGNGSTQWADSVTERFVLNWWQRRSLDLTAAFTAGRAYASSSWGEINTEIRNGFLTWADECITTAASGSVQAVTAGSTYSTAVGVDGTTPEDGACNNNDAAAGQANSLHPIVCGTHRTLSEGYHYVTLLGNHSGGSSGTYAGAASGNSRTAVRTVVRG